MKKNIRVYLIVVFSILSFKQQAIGQIDPHFTQNYIYPMAVNPALTGSLDGTYRVSSIYRSQWGNIMNPYSTVGLSAELATNKDINFGTSFFRQTAGDSGYEHSYANLSISYNGIRFGSHGDQEISFGAQGGFIHTRFDSGALHFGRQWLPGTGYDGGIGSGENLGRFSTFIPDISFGITYFDRTPGKAVSPFAGVSAYHLTKPAYSFLENGNNYKLPIRYSAQAGLKVVVNDGLYLVPNVIYNKQQEASEIVSALYAQFYINEDTDFMLGGNVRLKDSVSPFAGVFIKGVIVGLSYDVNTGPLVKNVPNSNAFEISISYSGGKRNASKSAYFNCPRF
jgi:type IX secretion system PorP/SprF family membrane protein